MLGRCFELQVIFLCQIQGHPCQGIVAFEVDFLWSLEREEGEGRWAS